MFPNRRTWAWLAISVMVFAVYASLLPFHFRRVPLDPAWQQFRAIMTSPSSDQISRTNFLANVLLFVPIGFGLAGAFLLDRTRPLALIPAACAVVPISIAVSLTAEFLQLFVPGRITALSDVEAQTAGCLIGLAAWAVMGQALTDWLRSARDSSHTDRLARALLAYAAAWVFVNLAPFDITVDLGDLATRVRTGLINIAPFATEGRPASLVVWDAVAAMVSAVPLGVLGLVVWMPRHVRRRPLQAFALGAALVGSIELAQVFISSHGADVTDVIFGCVGVAAGVSIGTRVVAAGRPIPSTFQGPRLAAWSTASLGAWCALLAGYHWMPYNFGIDVPSIQRKLATMSIVPFAGYAKGSDLNAFNDLLVKLGLSAPFGVIAAYVSRGAQDRTLLLVAWSAVAALLFGAIEFGQLFLPSRTPDPTDVLVGIAGTLAGLAIGRWLQGGSGSRLP